MTFTKTLLVVLSAATLSQTALAATNKVLLKNRSFKKKALPTQGFVSTAFGSSTTKGSGGADTIAITPGVRTSYLKGVVNGQLKLPVTRTDNGDEKFTSFGRPELSADYRTLHSRRQELRFGGALQLPIYNNSADGVGGELLESIKVWGLRPI